MSKMKFMERSFIDSALRDLFLEIFPEILQDLTNFLEENQYTDAVIDWLKDVILYNVPNGKLSRGLSVVTAFRYCGSNVNHINLRKACVLGWCIEMLQASFLIIEDMIDCSETRRGQQCWYVVNANHGNVGTTLKDAFVLENAMYFIIRKYFRQEACYADILTAFHDVVLKTTLGQGLTTKSGSGSTLDLQEMTMDQYQLIVKNRISFYSFYLPIYLAFIMSGINGEEYLHHIELICQQIGYIYQIQEDAMDCLFDHHNAQTSSQKENPTSFIAEGRYTWSILRAYELASEEQRTVLLESYGQGTEDQEKVERVKQIYKELNICQLFQDQEEMCLLDVNSLICQLGNPKHVQFFTFMVNSFYRRQR